MNEMIIMIEKPNIPKGSSLPTELALQSREKSERVKSFGAIHLLIRNKESETTYRGLRTGSQALSLIGRAKDIILEQAYLRLPIGNFCLSLLKSHSTSSRAAKTIAVHNKSNAESASEAVRDSEEE
jgi:hypothetical protein